MKKHYVLIDDSNPRFNLWLVETQNGYYHETFRKGINPNELDSIKEENFNNRIRITIDIDPISGMKIEIVPSIDNGIAGNGCHIGHEWNLANCYYGIKVKKY